MSELKVEELPRISISPVDDELSSDNENAFPEIENPRLGIELPRKPNSNSASDSDEPSTPRRRRFLETHEKESPRRESILHITLLSSKDDPRHSWNRPRATSEQSSELHKSSSIAEDLAASTSFEPKGDSPDQETTTNNTQASFQLEIPSNSEVSKPASVAEEQPKKLDDSHEEKEPSISIPLKERAKKFFKSQITYFRLHLLYFLLVNLVGSLIIYGLEKRNNVSYVDCLFTATSALTVTGLSSVDFSKFRVGSQVVVVILIFLGGNVLMTLPLVLTRRYYYKKFVSSHADEFELQIKTVNGISVLVSPEPKNILKGRWSIEYQALTKLAILVVLYLTSIVIFSIITMKIHFVVSRPIESVPETWVAIFHTFSAFNNAGFALFPDNLMQFYNDTYVPLLLSFLILAGNTMFPVFLRFLIWIIYIIKKKLHASDVDIYEYILKNPRRIFTHLFVSYQTRALLLINGGFILVELVAFLALDWKSEGVQHLSSYNKIICGWFQSVSTRTAGFNIVDISLLNPAIWVLYATLMYIAAYPVTIAVRASEEKEEEEDSVFQNKEINSKSSLKNISMQFLLRDMSWMFAVLFAICISESDRITNDPNFNIFKILFEIASAYGTVGLTLGYPGEVVSFSGRWTAFSKVALCLIMMLGRHRGLPDNIDKAVSFPSHLQMLEVARQESRRYEESLSMENSKNQTHA